MSMKKYLIYIIIAIAITGCVKAPTATPPCPFAQDEKATELSGVISTDTTLSGIVRIVKKVYVPENVTLTILPGTTVIMENNESTKVEPPYLMQNTQILIKGAIIAKGTKAEPIRFVSNLEKPGLKSYAGVILLNAKETQFEYCSFNNAENAILAIRTKISVNNVFFNRCFYALISISSDVRVENSTVKDCDKGIYFHKKSKGTVTGSHFSGCDEDAVFISKSSVVEVKGNAFKDNVMGVSTLLSRSRYMENEFINNKDDIFELNYH